MHSSLLRKLMMLERGSLPLLLEQDSESHFGVLSLEPAKLFGVYSLTA